MSENGTWVDGIRVSDVRLNTLRVPDRPDLTVRLGGKAHGRHIGGPNPSGRGFGIDPQDLVVRLKYT